MQSDRPIPDEELPETLQAQLREVYGKRVAIPSHVDRIILSSARVRLRRRTRFATVGRWSAVAAAAAMILFGVRVALFRPMAAPRLAEAYDVNGDGRVDIVDAYVIARALARHEKPNPAWDVNGDGVVDMKDVDLIARRAVTVSGGAQ